MIYRNAPLIFLLVCGIILFIVYSSEDGPNGSSMNTANKPTTYKKPSYLTLNDKNKTELKTILYWNEFYGRYDTYDFGFGHEAFIEKNCPNSGCFATKDRHLLPSLGINQFHE